MFINFLLKHVQTGKIVTSSISIRYNLSLPSVLRDAFASTVSCIRASSEETHYKVKEFRGANQTLRRAKTNVRKIIQLKNLGKIISSIIKLSLIKKSGKTGMQQSFGEVVLLEFLIAKGALSRWSLDETAVEFYPANDPVERSL